MRNTWGFVTHRIYQRLRCDKYVVQKSFLHWERVEELRGVQRQDGPKLDICLRDAEKVILHRGLKY
jgi:hypothetical protein